MMLYSLIPILSVYAGWRIRKFWVLLGINLVIGWGVGIPLGMVLPYPYGTIASIAIEVPISLLIVRHFAKKGRFPLARRVQENEGRWLPEATPPSERDQPPGAFAITGLSLSGISSFASTHAAEIAPHDVFYDEERHFGTATSR